MSTWLRSAAPYAFLYSMICIGCGAGAGQVYCPGNSTWDGSRCVGSLEPAAGSDGSSPTAEPGSVAGDYVGEISVEGRLTRVETHLSSAGGAITGNYVYNGTPGQFSNCAAAGSELSCTWTEGGMTGNFIVDFASDGSSFRGSWDYSDGRTGGSWTGQRQGGAAIPVAIADTPTGSSGAVAGNYQGTITVNGNSVPVATTLTDSGGVVSGHYTYGTAAGQFSGCQKSGEQLSCTWTEAGLTGGFRVTFNPGGFSGAWDYSDGTPGGSWSGTRQ